jgi:hypothetical protein
VSVAAALKSRGGAIAAVAIVFLAVFFALAGPSWGLALYRLLQDGGCSLLWLAAAGGMGFYVLKLFRIRTDNSLQLVTSVALGLGLVSLIVLGLGLAGLLARAVAIALLAAGDVLALIAIYPPAKTFDLSAWLREPAEFGWLWIAPAAVAGVATLAACFPPGLLWGDEPNGYDVVEYHLQVPREWYEAGRIIPLHHNVFSYFPFNVEMHYLLAMHLHGGFWAPWSAMYLAQMMHLAFCALAVWAVYALLGGGLRGVACAVLMAAVPWCGLLAPIAYNEGGTLLFGVLAVGWALRGKSLRDAILAGAFAGFAAGTKLSVAPAICIAVPIAVLIAAPRRLGSAGAFILMAALAVSPWLIRNAAWTGNPVFPEAMTALGHAHFTPVQVERWDRAYWPDPKYRTSLGRERAAWNEVLADERFGWVLFPLAVAATVIARKNRAAIALAFLLLFQLLVWMCFTHLQSRFMTIAIPIAALLVGQAQSRSWLAIAAASGLCLSIFSVYLLTEKLGKYLETDHTTQPLIGRESFEGFRMIDTRQLQPDQVLNLVGDGCAFWYQLPMSRLHYKTVFDVDTSDPGKSAEQAWLAGMPVGPNVVIWRDMPELDRLERTYYGFSNLPGN